MKFSSKISLHPLTALLFFVGFLTGYFRYIVYIFLIVLVHELGHVFFAKIFKRRVVSIELLPFGGLTKMEGRISEDIFEDLLIAVGGIFFQTVLGYGLIMMNKMGILDARIYTFLNSYNIFIIGFNLLPACPLDGYKIVKLVAELFIPYRLASFMTCIVSFIVLGIAFIMNPTIFLDNAFILIFLLFSIVDEMKLQKYARARFYVERMNYDFYYSRLDVSNISMMYKNRVNYIDGVHEKECLKNHFTKEYH